ncbi:MafI family immunity protein [Actinomadura geliboluensis]|uniref:MafI family immunity protein n=1 Tax=Actinomadura geliboluensis TaxID=882440 RepID=UPI00372233BA
MTSEEVIADVCQLMSVGEEELAFDTMCSWIFEDSLPITTAYVGCRIPRAEVTERSSVARVGDLC